jgi:hypothetical protein
MNQTADDHHITALQYTSSHTHVWGLVQLTGIHRYSLKRCSNPGSTQNNISQNYNRAVKTFFRVISVASASRYLQNTTRNSRYVLHRGRPARGGDAGGA